MSQYARKALTSLLLVLCAVFALASIGGGTKSKKKQSSFGFVPIRTTNGFTLKAGPNYKGSLMLSNTKTTTRAIPYNSLITYQQGNTTYILPYKYKMPATQSPKSNMQLLNLKMKIKK